MAGSMNHEMRIRELEGKAPKTGDTCERMGLYESACDQGHFKYYRRGEVFQVCAPCDLGVDWIPVERPR